MAHAYALANTATDRTAARGVYDTDTFTLISSGENGIRETGKNGGLLCGRCGRQQRRRRWRRNESRLKLYRTWTDVPDDTPWTLSMPFDAQ